MDDMKRFSTCLLLLLAVIVPMETFAGEPPATPGPVGQTAVPDPPPRQLDTIVVSGNVPGPAMWQVRKGDHVLYVLGAVSPLPNAIEWEAKQVREVLREADQVLGPPGVAISAKIGVFSGLMMLPAALKAKHNPEGRTLRDVLPADVYARWLQAKSRYIGHDAGIERDRPIVAAQELYQQALKRSRLGGKPVISPIIEQELKPRGMKITDTAFRITIDDPKAALREISAAGALADVDCMRKTLDYLDRDLPQAIARANAWSTGDIAALRALPLPTSSEDACLSALGEAEFARKRGINDIDTNVEKQWMSTVVAAIEKNPRTFAVLPMAQAMGRDGYLAKLEAMGYEVVAPE